MNYPNFIVIGAAKSGTSSLYYYLKQHPCVGMCSMKEPNFFTFEHNPPVFIQPKHDSVNMNDHYITDWNAYQQLFRNISTEKVVGDVSPMYMYRSEYTASRIKHYIPEAKIIAILRNPVDQAYSAFCHLLRDRREVSDNFSKLLSEAVQQERHDWPVMFRYLELGKYDEQLTPYFKKFSKENILIVLYDELLEDTAVVVQKIYKFLDVDSSFVIDTEIKNASNVRPTNLGRCCKKILPKSMRKYVTKCVPAAIKRKNTQTFIPPNLTLDAQAILQDAYAPHIARLETLIGREISQWEYH